MVQYISEIFCWSVIEMSIKNKFVQIRDGYVIRQARNAKIPTFEKSEMKRYQIVFSGRVQHVGFRLEVSELADRLGLTGFCKNLDNGDVLAELQGEEKRIQFLISFMESLKRIKITNKQIEILGINQSETIFQRER